MYAKQAPSPSSTPNRPLAPLCVAGTQEKGARKKNRYMYVKNVCMTLGNLAKFSPLSLSLSLSFVGPAQIKLHWYEKYLLNAIKQLPDGSSGEGGGGGGAGGLCEERQKQHS